MLASMNYKSPLCRKHLEIALTARNRKYATKFAEVFICCDQSDPNLQEMDWLIQLFFDQLVDPSPKVRRRASKILQKWLPKYPRKLHYMERLRTTDLSDVGYLIRAVLMTDEELVKQYHRSAAHAVKRWMEMFNNSYISILEDDLHLCLGFPKRSVDYNFARHSTVQKKIPESFLTPCHLFDSLSQHEFGRNLLLDANRELCERLKTSVDLNNVEDMKGAVIALGFVIGNADEKYVESIADFNVAERIIKLAETCPYMGLRVIAFFAANMMTKSEYGITQLIRCGWAVNRRPDLHLQHEIELRNANYGTPEQPALKDSLDNEEAQNKKPEVEILETNPFYNNLKDVKDRRKVIEKREPTTPPLDRLDIESDELAISINENLNSFYMDVTSSSSRRVQSELMFPTGYMRTVDFYRPPTDPVNECNLQVQILCDSVKPEIDTYRALTEGLSDEQVVEMQEKAQRMSMARLGNLNNSHAITLPKTPSNVLKNVFDVKYESERDERPHKCTRKAYLNLEFVNNLEGELENDELNETNNEDDNIDQNKSSTSTNQCQGGTDDNDNKKHEENLDDEQHKSCSKTKVVEGDIGGKMPEQKSESEQEDVVAEVKHAQGQDDYNGQNSNEPEGHGDNEEVESAATDTQEANDQDTVAQNLKSESSGTQEVKDEGTFTQRKPHVEVEQYEEDELTTQSAPEYPIPETDYSEEQNLSEEGDSKSDIEDESSRSCLVPSGLVFGARVQREKGTSEDEDEPPEPDEYVGEDEQEERNEEGEEEGALEEKEEAFKEESGVSEHDVVGDNVTEINVANEKEEANMFNDEHNVVESKVDENATGHDVANKEREEETVSNVEHNVVDENRLEQEERVSTVRCSIAQPELADYVAEHDVAKKKDEEINIFSVEHKIEENVTGHDVVNKEGDTVPKIEHITAEHKIDENVTGSDAASKEGEETGSNAEHSAADEKRSEKEEQVSTTGRYREVAENMAQHKVGKEKEVEEKMPNIEHNTSEHKIIEQSIAEKEKEEEKLTKVQQNAAKKKSDEDKCKPKIYEFEAKKEDTFEDGGIWLEKAHNEKKCFYCANKEHLWKLYFAVKIPSQDAIEQYGEKRRRVLRLMFSLRIHEKARYNKLAEYHQKYRPLFEHPCMYSDAVHVLAECHLNSDARRFIQSLFFNVFEASPLTQYPERWSFNR